tara:strand:+ start:1851 stop:3050 length:1200 start_codon:yes stop_codon:yes gene_type:complete
MFKRGNLEKQIGNIPKNTKWCANCAMSNQRPRIVFDKNNVCSACKYFDYKKTVDWNKREKELENLLDFYRSKNNQWDVIVPSSGGKDSAYVAHELKFKYKMNPLLVTWSPLEYTDIGFKNFNALNDNGFTCLKASPNGKLQRKLARLCFEEFGDAFHVFVLGQIYYPVHMALKFNIKLIFYGENGEVEYAGDPASKDRPFTDLIENENWLKGYLKGTSLEDLIKYGLKNKDYFDESDKDNPDLKFYKPPEKEDMISKNISKIFYYNYFKNWNPQENFYYASENTGFIPNPERTEGTYSKYASLDDKMDGMHYYMRYIKFGLGRCVEDASHEIREGHISREEGISLINKYEGEFPEKYFQDFLNYLDISKEHFWDVVDSWRAPHLWERKGNKWELKNQIK